jgi:Mg/Co/Ni transporter MgtE
VYRYARGKADWLAFGLPREGGADHSTVADLVTREVSTCHPDDRVDRVLSRVAKRTRWCVVVNEERVVLGLLPVRASGHEPAEAVQAVMQAAPLTIRPDTTPADARKHAKGRSREPMVVTRSDGRLLGLLEPRRLRRPRPSRAQEQHASV